MEIDLNLEKRFIFFKQNRITNGIWIADLSSLNNIFKIMQQIIN